MKDLEDICIYAGELKEDKEVYICALDPGYRCVDAEKWFECNKYITPPDGMKYFDGENWKHEEGPRE